jgi:hypothetical protein
MQQAPPLLVVALFAGVLLVTVGLINHAANWHAAHRNHAVAVGSGTTINAQNIESVAVHGGPQSENAPSAGSSQVMPQNSQGQTSGLYPPIRNDELSQANIRNRTIYIADYAWKVRALRWTNAVIIGRRFEDCRIYGPAVLAPMNTGQVEGHTFFDCGWTEGGNAFWMPRPIGHPSFVGLIGLLDCAFVKCEFTQVGIVVPPEDYERYKEGRY